MDFKKYLLFIIVSILLTGCATDIISCNPNITISGTVINNDGSINADLAHFLPGVKCKF